MPKPLDPALWAEIRRHWEFDVDSPSFSQAAARAANAHGFAPPVRSAVHRKAEKERWERRGNMTGVAAAAHLQADVAMSEDGGASKKSAVAGAVAAQQSFSEAVEDHAQVLARHRREWSVIGQLRSEALEHRQDDPVGSFNRAKLAKISAETLALKQNGERRAWGLDVPEIPPDFSKLSDEQLERLAAGKPI